jgi:hypothetical protein
MQPVSGIVQRIPSHWPVRRGVNASLVQGIDILLRQIGSSECIVQEIDVNPRLRARGKQTDRCICDEPRARVVHLHRDGSPCRAEIAPEALKRTIAVGQHVDLIAGGETHADNELERCPELVGRHRGR